MLEPHVRYVKHVLEKYPGIKSIYILAAGRNVAAAKALKTLLENEFKTKRVKITTKEYTYEGKYKDAPRMKLYVGRIRIEQY
jgi:fructoselysine-6-P-deglycase FrlB-like protein